MICNEALTRLIPEDLFVTAFLPSFRKLFVGGLSWETKEGKLECLGADWTHNVYK